MPPLSIPTSVSEYGALALDHGATDLHFMPERDQVKVYARAATRLKLLHHISQDQYNRILNMVKFEGGLDVADARVPQETRLRLNVGSTELDVRASIIPTIHGAALALRIARFGITESLQSLGTSHEEERVLLELLTQGRGVFLVTGLTGSGKTTTFYNLLALLAKAGQKVMTVEDPVERYIDSVLQVQAYPDLGLGFQEAIRAALRHDIDVLGIGEIRDSETAVAAVNAAFSVRLVIATMHSTDLGHALKRLYLFGVPPMDARTLLLGMSHQSLITLMYDDRTHDTAVFCVSQGPYRCDESEVVLLSRFTHQSVQEKMQEFRSRGYTVFNRYNDLAGGDSRGDH